VNSEDIGSLIKVCKMAINYWKLFKKNKLDKSKELEKYINNS